MKKNNMRVRYESFGGIVGLEKPASLVFVDQDFMKKIGYSDTKLWEKQSNRLSAPTEIHLSLTGKCNRNCSHCYMSSGPDAGFDDMSFEEIKSFIDTAADMGVFHMALGGGESLLREDLFEIAAYIRSKGMVPNLTTNGTIMSDDLAEQCRIFGQINISLDSLILAEKQPRDYVPVEKLSNTMKILKKHKNKVGINCVITRQNYDEIEDIVKFAKKHKLEDVEFLRLKPQGRGKDVYDNLKCTSRQHADFFPLIMKLSKKYNINLKMDCSYVPMMCASAPETETLDQFYIRGCFGGDMLAAVSPSGRVSPCSFAEASEYKADQFEKAWNESEAFKKFYTWAEKAPEPCRSCQYLSICRGGCHVVTEFLTGSFYEPDPECPIVVEYLKDKDFKKIS